MSEQLCFQCFRIKGDYEVCPWCGYTADNTENQAYQLRPGTVLNDRYIIGTTLGIGGFGITYKAYDTVLSIVVAIKEFYPARLVNRGVGETKVGIFSGEKQKEYNHFLERFQEEAQIMAKFSGEQDIVNIYDYIQANHTAYIIMEYMDGMLLKDRLEQSGKMTVEEATGYIIAILSALSKVHYYGIVHKDISPDNIFITGEGQVKLADFGAARLQGTKSGEKTEAIVKVGYTPPEQYQGGCEQGAFMDIYAAGAVFYEMLTGEKPQDAMDRQMEDTLQSPAECGIELEEKLDRIVMKAMALNPRYRFQTAEQFKNAIVNRKKVELPREEIYKRKWIRRLIGTVAAASVAVSLSVLLLSQTVFSSRGKINVDSIQEDTIEIWLAVEDQEEKEKLQKSLIDDMQEKCPRITVEVEFISAQDYEKRLQDALEKEELPEVFCTDYLSEELKLQEYCENLDLLLNSMDKSAYLFLPELNSRELYELPTAFQTAVVYVNESKAEEIPASYTLESLKEAAESLDYAEEADVYLKFQKKKSDIMLIAGDLSAMEAVKEVTVDQIPPTNFKVVPVLEGDRLIGCFQGCYGMKKSEDDNKKEAAMLVLSSLLSDGMQSFAYMNNENGIPINKSVYEDYKEYKMTTYLAFLKEYGEAEIVIQEGRDMCEILKR